MSHSRSFSPRGHIKSILWLSYLQKESSIQPYIESQILLIQFDEWHSLLPHLLLIFYSGALIVLLKLSLLCWYIITTGIIWGIWMRRKMKIEWEKARKKSIPPSNTESFVIVISASTSIHLHRVCFPSSWGKSSDLPIQVTEFESFFSNGEPSLSETGKKLRRQQKEWQRARSFF